MLHEVETLKYFDIRNFDIRNSVVSPLLTIACSMTDGLDATAMVKLNIRDVNDNPPVFKQISYNLNLVRNTKPQTVIVNVEAVDKDSSIYGRVTYQIISGNNEALFSVGASSGLHELY
jgi:hypothetical protein